jgi:UDP-glucose 4-epimerase
MLITGGAGFIGSHLASMLLNQGHVVRVIDDLSTGTIVNIQELNKYPLFEFTQGSVLDREVTAEAIDWCDVIFHLAAAVGVKHVVDDPVGAINTNFETTSLVLECAVTEKKTVLITSTSEVYGSSQKIPFREDHNPILGLTNNGRWSYACTKALDEFLGLAYYQQYGLPVIVVRLFNTVGPRQAGRYGMVVPRFVQQALKNLPITVYGDGTQTRCFGHVSDVVHAISGLVENPKAVGEVFNIGNDERISIAELANLVIEICGSSSKLKFIPYEGIYEGRFDDMQHRVPDLQKIQRLIGYKPQIDLRQTITSVVNHYSQQGTNFDIF